MSRADTFSFAQDGLRLRAKRDGWRTLIKVPRMETLGRAEAVAEFTLGTRPSDIFHDIFHVEEMAEIEFGTVPVNQGQDAFEGTAGIEGRHEKRFVEAFLRSLRGEQRSRFHFSLDSGILPGPRDATFFMMPEEGFKQEFDGFSTLRPKEARRDGTIGTRVLHLLLGPGEFRRIIKRPTVPIRLPRKRRTTLIGISTNRDHGVNVGVEEFGVALGSPVTNFQADFGHDFDRHGMDIARRGTTCTLDHTQPQLHFGKTGESVGAWVEDLLGSESQPGEMMEMDDERYAAGEAMLGWDISR